MKTRANRQLCVGLKTNYKQLKDIKNTSMVQIKVVKTNYNVLNRV